MDDYFAGPVGVGVTILLEVLEAVFCWTSWRQGWLFCWTSWEQEWPFFWTSWGRGDYFAGRVGAGVIILIDRYLHLDGRWTFQNYLLWKSYWPNHSLYPSNKAATLFLKIFTPVWWISLHIPLCSHCSPYQSKHLQHAHFSRLKRVR